jgi:hypothetical protein
MMATADGKRFDLPRREKWEIYGMRRGNDGRRSQKRGEGVGHRRYEGTWLWC